jgi:hypothetical protein
MSRTTACSAADSCPRCRSRAHFAVQDRFFSQMIDEGIVSCIERVLQFCKRQQQRIAIAGSADIAMAASLPPSSSSSAGAPAYTSSLSSPATLSWLRLLCLDFLTSLQAACPGFIRTFMQPHSHHVADRARVAGADIAILQADEVEEVDEEVKTGEVKRQRDKTIRRAKPPLPLNPNKHWKIQHEVS